MQALALGSPEIQATKRSAIQHGQLLWMDCFGLWDIGSQEHPVVFVPFVAQRHHLWQSIAEACMPSSIVAEQ